MSYFICPKCKEKLELENKTYKCSNNHCYDLSKEGYVNLLPINSKKSKEPGDNSKMIAARRDFLETGYYKPLADRVITIIDDLIDTKKCSILDLGCGEGYYTGLISKNLNFKSFCALDISKIAVKYGSKRYKDVNFCVASAFDIPLEENSVDMVYRIYAPSSKSELNRIIKKNGYLITVTPGDRHLLQLRELIYDEVLNLSTKNDETETLKKIKTENLQYTIEITEHRVLENLLNMTPFGWKIKPNDLESLLSLKKWDIDVDFKIKVYKKDHK